MRVQAKLYHVYLYVFPLEGWEVGSAGSLVEKVFLSDFYARRRPN